MNNGYRYLHDEEFLKKIDTFHIKEQHIRILVLDFMTENPIYNIEGQATGGTINLAGNSAVRRTGNLSMVTPNENVNLLTAKSMLSINKKISLEIGFTNFTDSYLDYNIIWMPLGVYVISEVSISNSTSGLNISLQLKDKMSLLNGECGGTIPASTQFDEYETIDETGKYILSKPTIYQIIQEVVHHFGGEDLGKIIISDVPDRIKQTMKWTGSKPLYLMNKNNDMTYTATLDEPLDCTLEDPASITISKGKYKKYQQGDNVGYIYVDFVYPNELITDAGATVCDVLDSIKKLLGNFEYYYDIEGNFRFQEIKNYLNNAQSTTELNKFKQLTELNENNYILDFTKGKSVYSFDDATLVTAYSNTPQYNMIKNDFIVWGKREIAGLELPIRYHLAIDKKPEIQDATYHRWLYTDPDTEITSLRKPIIISPLPQPGSVDYYYTEGDGSPAYPVYYWDVETQGYIALNTNLYKAVEPNGNPNKMTDWRYQLYLSDAEAGDQGLEPSRYYAEMKAEFPKIFDVENEEYIKTYDGADLDYWLDFIDSDAAIQELSVNNIGVRSKVVVDDSINCLFEPAIPEVVYIRLDDEEMAEKKQEANDNGVPWSVTSETIYDALAYGGGFNSAYDLVRSLLYQYTSYNEGITLQTIPIYHLEPNTRISVVNGASGISGDYVINSMSIPLDINGTMSISCTRALERL